MFLLKFIKSKYRQMENKKYSKKLKLVYEIDKPESKKSSSLSKIEVLKKIKVKSSKQETKSLNRLEKEDLEDEKFPKNFSKIWNLIQKMRKEEEAPVDTMGVSCSSVSKDPAIYKFQTLISLILSSQTKDPVTFATMKKLIDYGLTVENIANSSIEKITDLIYGVSFHNNKAKYIKELAVTLKEKYNSNPPETYLEITSFKGLGPKMTYLYLQICCNKTEGIAVDVHVHRIANRLKWVNETKNPEETRKQLQSWLPKDKWADINDLLVGFGQTICYALRPKCQECLLNNICEVGKENLKNLNKKENNKRKSKKNEEESIEKEEEMINLKRKNTSKIKRKKTNNL